MWRAGTVGEAAQDPLKPQLLKLWNLPPRSRHLRYDCIDFCKRAWWWKRHSGSPCSHPSTAFWSQLRASGVLKRVIKQRLIVLSLFFFFLNMYGEAICCISSYNSIVINIYFIIRVRWHLHCTLLIFCTMKLAEESTNQRVVLTILQGQKFTRVTAKCSGC